ncbi:MAG TPA: hypothetical protein PLM33_06465 [Acidobacteriota bacterium]|jgi:DNA-directed RNA polymerase subunit RPC12/RpoP|nr:hypothetical protein [Acidobacteriota bacterium]HRR27604.1 hypothetical protein [Acidobacteriota bacterium]HRV08243.1 hypothetical protein [Acidobacteriota bacterium]
MESDVPPEHPPAHEEARKRLPSCPECGFVVLERPPSCPYCGARLTAPGWKKALAWLLLVLIGYGLARCALRLTEGFD